MVFSSTLKMKELIKYAASCRFKTSGSCHTQKKNWNTRLLVFFVWKEKEPETWKKLHVGGVDGISCQHFQVMMMNFLQKHWGWQENRNSMTKQGSEVRPTMYVASMDIKTAFDDARPRHISKICGGSQHPWMGNFGSLARDGSVGGTGHVRVSSPLIGVFAKVASKLPDCGCKRGRGMGEEKNGSYLGCGRKKDPSDVQFLVGRQLLDHVPFKESPREMIKDLVQEAENRIWHRSRQVYGGQVPLPSKTRRTFPLIPRQGATKFPLRESSRFLDAP